MQQLWTVCDYSSYCSDSMYLFKLLTRNCTSEELWLWLICQNSSRPQTGISLEPCAGTYRLPWMAFVTWSEGYLPPFLLANVVKSDGGTFSASAAGPRPLASIP